MNLDELQLKWAEYDTKLDRSIRLNSEVLGALKIGKTRSAMQRFIGLVSLDLIVNLVIILWLGSFVADHTTSARFGAAGLVLALFFLVLIASSIRQLILASAIDYRGPIAPTQELLASLSVHKFRRTKWTLLAAPLLWTPLLVVFLKVCFDVDAYRFADGMFVLANLAFGVMVIGVATWISKRYAARLANSTFRHRLMREMAGYNLNAAADNLRKLQSFEKES